MADTPRAACIAQTSETREVHVRPWSRVFRMATD
jgi:hypothetical protein